MDRHSRLFRGIKLILVGMVILANEIYFNYSWWLLIGSMLILFGILKIFKNEGRQHHEEKKTKHRK